MKPLRRLPGLSGLALAACLVFGFRVNAAGAAPPAASQAAPAPATVWAPLQAQAGGGLQRLALPWTLLSAARDARLESVQVLDAQGQVLPSAWAGQPPDAQSRRELNVPLWAWPDETQAPDASRSLDIELDPQGRIRRVQVPAQAQPRAHAAGSVRWLLDLSALRDPAERPLDLQLDWPTPSGGQALTVQLQASDDAQHWRPLRSAQLLDLPAAAPAPALKLRRIDWPLDQALPPYLRLQFDTQVALRAVTLGIESRQRPGLAIESLSWQPEARQTSEPPRWRLDLPLALRPEALRVQLPALNQLLSLRLEQRQQEGQAWLPVQRFVAWRMQRGGVEGQSPAEPVQASAARQWRLVAEGPVPAALAQGALSLQWLWRPPQLVSLLPADPVLLAGLRLKLGSPAPGPGHLALQTLMPGYQPGSEYQLPEARPGAAQVQPAPAAPPAWEDPATRKRWGLWAVLGLSVLGLAGLAWRLKGELGDGEPPQA
ncbi:DUF3999 family protein [Mitsuaria sp. WAJ17]|uniref:DUF3999 family protein n=1 Tax=Mitsuaria sp. WAJ17 TaxID=2761452 RepID=UPI0016030838|nr:DUF3999 family protein [Mitsuaria sp. WAJ17]MBB2487346.1 DUF3999 family protein [Mitsuaria sp. WAJ17]